jgi:ABC-type antimicrobial peptide transport system permease subunit
VTAQLLRTTSAAARASSVWATAADVPALRARVAAAAGPGAVVSTAGGTFVSRFLSGAVLSTWLGAAGCALLAVAAVAAAISSSLRRRRGEVVVLRAVGLSAGQQAWSRRLEVIGVAVASALFGLAGGVAVVLLVANTLARLSVVTAPSTLSVQGRVDPIGLALGLGALTAALALAVWAYGRAVRRQAADTAYREETR